MDGAMFVTDRSAPPPYISRMAVQSMSGAAPASGRFERLLGLSIVSSVREQHTCEKDDTQTERDRNSGMYTRYPYITATTTHLPTHAKHTPLLITGQPSAPVRAYRVVSDSRLNCRDSNADSRLSERDSSPSPIKVVATMAEMGCGWWVGMRACSLSCTSADLHHHSNERTIVARTHQEKRQQGLCGVGDTDHVKEVTKDNTEGSKNVRRAAPNQTIGR